MTKKEKKQPIVPREVLRAFIKENNIVTAADAQNALKELFACTIQEMLEAEMDYELGYEKHDDKNKRQLIDETDITKRRF